MNKLDKEAAEEARAMLRKWIKPGGTVYAQIVHVSNSGLLRVVRLYLILPDSYKEEPYIQNISRLAWRAGVSSWNEKHEGLSFTGGNYSATFEAVYNLGGMLWPKGNGKYISGRNGDKTPETDGGYMLRERPL